MDIFEAVFFMLAGATLLCASIVMVYYVKTQRAILKSKRDAAASPRGYRETNFNNTARLRLTDFGREVYRKKMGMPAIETDGVYQGQLWHVIEIFGEHMGWGSDEQPFETYCFELEVH